MNNNLNKYNPKKGSILRREALQVAQATIHKAELRRSKYDRKPSKPKLIIDIDGVLCSCHGAYSERTPNAVNIIRVNYLSRHYKIVLFTSRFKRDRDITTKWLKQHDVFYDSLIMGKPRGVYYIDDRNISLEELYETDARSYENSTTI